MMAETIDRKLAEETYEQSFYRRAPLLGDIGVESIEIDHNTFDDIAAKMHRTHPFSRPVIDSIIQQVDDGVLEPKLGAIELLFIEAEE